MVEIVPDAQPPVAKIIDYKKFKYQEERKEKEARKNTKQTELKEVRFSPFIGEHDLQTGLEKAKKFLLDGDIVKISIHFKGRQMAHTEFGAKLFGRIMVLLEEYAEVDRDPKFEGRRFIGIIRSKKGIAKQKTQEVKNETENQKSSS